MTENGLLGSRIHAPLSSVAKLTVEIGQEANQLCLALVE